MAGSRVRAALTCGTDVKVFRRGYHARMITPPALFGHELAGTIEETGAGVRGFAKGMRVVALNSAPCQTCFYCSRHQENLCEDLLFNNGAYAEYIRIPRRIVDLNTLVIPPHVSFEEAATIPAGALEAWRYLRGNIKPGQKVLIIGAGGSIGSFAVQIAKYYGGQVTGLDRTEKLDMLRSIGADYVIDYKREDFTKSGLTYDVIFDAPGKSSESQCAKLLAQNGRYLTANPGPSVQIRTVLNVFTRTNDAMARYADRRNEDLRTLRELLETGKVKPFIDRTYPLEQTAEAHRYADTGLKKGNIVITVA